jgi:hypothetical protein
LKDVLKKLKVFANKTKHLKINIIRLYLEERNNMEIYELYIDPLAVDQIVERSSVAIKEDTKLEGNSVQKESESIQEFLEYYNNIQSLLGTTATPLDKQKLPPKILNKLILKLLEGYDDTLETSQECSECS